MDKDKIEDQTAYVIVYCDEIGFTAEGKLMIALHSEKYDIQEAKSKSKSKCVYWQEYTKNTIQAKNI